MKHHRLLPLAAVSFALLSPRPVSGVDRPHAQATERRTTDGRPTQGRTTLRFTERHSLSSCDSVCQRTGLKRELLPNRDRDDQWEYDPADESFEVFVPRTYRPGVPHGLFVWISPTRADLPNARYFETGRSSRSRRT